MGKKQPSESQLVATAFHVVKAAFVDVLGDRCAETKDVSFISLSKGSVTVSFSGDKPENDVIERVLAVANEKIAADLPVEHETLTDEAAKAKFDGVVVNRQKFALPFRRPVRRGKNKQQQQKKNKQQQQQQQQQSQEQDQKDEAEQEEAKVVHRVHVVQIKDNTIGAVDAGTAAPLASTGELSSIRFLKVSIKKKKIDAQFVVGDDAAASSTASGGGYAKKPKKKNNNNNIKSKKKQQGGGRRMIGGKSLVGNAADELLAAVIDKVAQVGNDEALQQELLGEFEQVLTTLQNTSYTNGFTCTRGKTFGFDPKFI